MRQLQAWPCICAVLLLVLAACGDDDDATQPAVVLAHDTVEVQTWSARLGFTGTSVDQDEVISWQIYNDDQLTSYRFAADGIDSFTFVPTEGRIDFSYPTGGRPVVSVNSRVARKFFAVGNRSLIPLNYEVSQRYPGGTLSSMMRRRVADGWLIVHNIFLPQAANRVVYEFLPDGASSTQTLLDLRDRELTDANVVDFVHTADRLAILVRSSSSPPNYSYEWWDCEKGEACRVLPVVAERPLTFLSLSPIHQDFQSRFVSSSKADINLNIGVDKFLPTRIEERGDFAHLSFLDDATAVHFEAMAQTRDAQLAPEEGYFVRKGNSSSPANTAIYRIQADALELVMPADVALAETPYFAGELTIVGRHGQTYIGYVGTVVVELDAESFRPTKIHHLNIPRHWSQDQTSIKVARLEGDRLSVAGEDPNFLRCFHASFQIGGE